MARKKQRKKSWLRALVLFLVVPLAVWLIALLIWFFWYELKSPFTEDAPIQVIPKPARQSEKNDRRERRSEQPQEKIFEEDRKELQDILKQRN